MGTILLTAEPIHAHAWKYLYYEKDQYPQEFLTDMVRKYRRESVIDFKQPSEIANMINRGQRGIDAVVVNIAKGDSRALYGIMQKTMNVSDLNAANEQEYISEFKSKTGIEIFEAYKHVPLKCRMTDHGLHIYHDEPEKSICKAFEEFLLKLPKALTIPGEDVYIPLPYER